MENLLNKTPIIQNIYSLRNTQIMLDRDLAQLYDVKPIRLREQVKRNRNRFPEKFMFQLTIEEVEYMVSQNAIPSKQHLGGYLPFAITEHGILMLANVLKSTRAIHLSIGIIEVFVELREQIQSHKELILEFEKIRNRLAGQDEQIRLILEYLQKFSNHNYNHRKEIGYKSK